jgi:hypothetical protein
MRRRDFLNLLGGCALIPAAPAGAADTFPTRIALAGTPLPILSRVHDATVAALGLPEVREQLREQGAEVVGGTPAELAAYVAAETPSWRESPVNNAVMLLQLRARGYTVSAISTEALFLVLGRARFRPDLE